MKKLTLALCLGLFAVAASAQVLGSRPSYLESVTEAVPNAAALRSRIWVPGLEDDYVPQGLTAAGPYLYVSSYKPTPDLKSGTGPCRVYRIEIATGRTAGAFDIPPGTCTHAGGLEYAGNGRLLLSDTWALFLIDIERAIATGTSAGASKSVKTAGSQLRGSYSTFDGTDAWIGTWTREAPKARMYRLPLRVFDEFDGQTIDETKAAGPIPVPLEAQGAAFDKAGNIWVSASGSKWGKLYRLDREGNVKAEYAMVPGLEDLAVDDTGRLWGMSESGTRKYLTWDHKFPFLFHIDTTQLK